METIYIYITIHVILFEYLRGNLIAATDASVSEGRAGHAFCYANKKSGKVLFSSGSKVTGDVNFATSYRAEMVSIIATMTLLDLILQSVGIKKGKWISTQIVRLQSRQQRTPDNTHYIMYLPMTWT